MIKIKDLFIKPHPCNNGINDIADSLIALDNDGFEWHLNISTCNGVASLNWRKANKIQKERKGKRTKKRN